MRDRVLSCLIALYCAGGAGILLAFAWLELDTMPLWLKVSAAALGAPLALALSLMSLHDAFWRKP